MNASFSLSLDRASSTPLYRQLVDQIAERIRTGELRPGTKLPPTRDLVDTLEVNRSTAVAAYRRLEELGLVRSRVGDGTRVQAPELSPLDPARELWESRTSESLRFLLRDMDDAVEAEEAAGPESPSDDSSGKEKEACDFSRLAPDSSLFPVEPLGRALAAALKRGGGELLQYGSGRGLPALRETIAARLARIGFPADAERILIVSGAQQGLDLLLRAFTAPGDRVAVESPTYSGVLPLLSFGRLEVEAIPMTPSGVDLARLEKVTSELPIRLFYTMPTFHNPTGVTTNEEHRRSLVRLAREKKLLVVEDGFEDELGFAGDPPAPLASLDPDAGLLYLGTFSKGLFPGFRIGWLAGDPEVIRRLAILKKAVDYGTPPLLQAAVDELCRSGAYDDHLAHLQKIYAGRRKALEKAAQKHLPPGCGITVPTGGYAFWLRLPPGASGERVAREAATERVYVTPASRFLPPGAPPIDAIRLSVSRVGNWEIDRGIKVLGKIIGRLARSGARFDRATEAVPTL